eukprot:4972425-Prorocentrum_lima.AAC.1
MLALVLRDVRSLHRTSVFVRGHFQCVARQLALTPFPSRLAQWISPIPLSCSRNFLPIHSPC